MRGDAGLTARLLLRGAGFAGVVTATGGGLAVVGASRAWHVVVVEVGMLGGSSTRRVAAVPGVPTTVSGWVAAALGVVIVGLGVALALDRSPPRGRLLAGGAAILLAAAGVTALTTVPEVAAIAGGRGAELLDLREQLPVGVELELRSRAGPGPWWVLIGAALTSVGASTAQDR